MVHETNSATYKSDPVQYLFIICITNHVLHQPESGFTLPS